MGAVTVASFLAPPAKNFMAPDLARILFFHLPCAILSSLWIIASGLFGFQWLRTRKRIWDHRLAAAIEITNILALLTLITGIIFSKVQWGAWWSWDPRQTSFLFVQLLLLAGWALRAAIADDQRRADVSASYAVMTLLPTLFLIFVLPRLPQMLNGGSLHPSTTLQRSEMDATYRTIFISALVTVGWMVWELYDLRIRISSAHYALDHAHGQLEMDRNGAASPRVVRPLSQPENQPESTQKH